jgi:two-component system, OmpR family, KDP operon response regulator KdpE
MKPRILIIEDEADIRRFVSMALEQEGMTTYEATTVRQALIEAASRRPDLVVLDLGLPDTDGKDLIREVRTWSNVPIVVLSARDSEAEKVDALNLGADDYLVKPFGVPELLARVRAQLRRAALAGIDDAGAAVRFGKVVINLATHEVRRDGRDVHLTPIEFRLLGALIRGQGKVITHRQLLHEVWGPGYSDRPHYLRIYMAQLRQKLEDNPAQPVHLITELQVGYRLC